MSGTTVTGSTTTPTEETSITLINIAAETHIETTASEISSPVTGTTKTTSDLITNNISYFSMTTIHLPGDDVATTNSSYNVVSNVIGIILASITFITLTCIVITVIGILSCGKMKRRKTNSCSSQKEFDHGIEMNGVIISKTDTTLDFTHSGKSQKDRIACENGHAKPSHINSRDYREVKIHYDMTGELCLSGTGTSTADEPRGEPTYDLCERDKASKDDESTKCSDISKDKPDHVDNPITPVYSIVDMTKKRKMKASNSEGLSRPIPGEVVYISNKEFDHGMVGDVVYSSNKEFEHSMGEEKSDNVNEALKPVYAVVDMTKKKKRLARNSPHQST